MRFACRARCISIAIACASSPAASAPSTSVSGRRAPAPSCPRAQRHAARRGGGGAAGGLAARRYLQRQHLIDVGAAALAYLTELTHRRPRTWIPEVERLHELLQTHGDAAIRTAFERGLAEPAIGAEYIAHYLGTTMSPLPFEESDRPPTISASSLPRGSRVQCARGARRGGAERSPWTRLSTAASSRRVGGRS